MQMIAKVATIDPLSNALCRLPVFEKCCRAKNPAIANEMIAPACVPLHMKEAKTISTKNSKQDNLV